MKNEEPTSGPLYPAEEYAVRPEVYHPAALDEVALHLQRKFNLEALPAAGLVRHVIASPESGLERFLREKKGEELGKGVKKRIEEVHAPEIKRLIQHALLRSKEKPAPEEPVRKYQGLLPLRTIEYHSPIDTKPATWAMTAIARIGENGSDIAKLEQVFLDLAREAESSEMTAMKGVREQLLFAGKRAGELSGAFEQAPDEDAKNRAAFAFQMGTRAMLNSMLLIEHGLCIGNETSRSGKDFIPFRLHEMEIYDSPYGEIGVALSSEIAEEPSRKSPMYDGVNDIVLIDAPFLAAEMRMTIMHGYTGSLAKTLGSAVGDYRHGRMERDYYKSLWDRHGNDALTERMIVEADPRNSAHDVVKSLSDTQLFRATCDAVKAEEIRHAIDTRTIKKHLQDHDGELPDDFVPYSALFKPESRICAALLSEPLPATREEKEMLFSCTEELVGKISATAVCPDPHLMLSHLAYCVEQSRLLSQNRTQKFRDDLAEAKKGIEESASWGHPLSAKIAAVLLGRHFGIYDKPFDLDAEYDHVELKRVYERLGKRTPEEIRLAIKQITDPEFAVPVDCKPFGKIDGKGRLVEQES